MCHLPALRMVCRNLRGGRSQQLSAQESISRNLKFPFYQVGQMCHLVCLSSQHRHLTLGISNCHFTGGVDLLSCVPELSVQESISRNLKLLFTGGLDLLSGLPEFFSIGIYQQESQIAILWRGQICHMVCLSSQQMNLSVGISNCHFVGGDR